ncbi:MAG: hypothetical protein JNJ89_12790 [Rubrivivax sp.]|nr:hypothetical protein [Rubrivivax sp.]
MNDVHHDARRELPGQSSAGIEPGRRGSEPERWLALVWRTAHLGAVVTLGAALLGAPVPLGPAAWGVVGSGALLLAQDLRAGRVALVEMAGAVVVLKLLLSAAIAWRPEHATVVFWLLLALSSLSSHAPKRWRHWTLRRH